MVDVHSPRLPLTVHLPDELIEELRLLAREKNLSIDDVVMEACLAYVEPYTRERCYRERRRAHPDEPLSEFGIDGDEIVPPGAALTARPSFLVVVRLPATARAANQALQLADAHQRLANRGSR